MSDDESTYLSCMTVSGARPALAACLLAISLCVPAAGLRAAGELTVEFKDDVVNIRAHDATVREVLEKIIDQTELVVVSRAALDRPLTLEVDGVPLPEALKRILHSEAFMLHEAISPVTAPRKLWIFSTGESTPRRAITLGTPGSGNADLADLRDRLLSEDVEVRRGAVKALRRLGGDSSLEPLAQAVSDADERVRVEAMYGLADIGGETATAALLSALTDSSPWGRQEAAYAIGVAGGEIARHALPQALRDPNLGVREIAVRAYADLGAAAAADGLTTALKDSDAAIRLEAVELLGEPGGAAAVPVLKRAIHDPNQRVAEAAILVLGDIGSDESLRALAAALDGPDPVLRAQAADTLVDIGGDTARLLLDRAENQEGKPTTRIRRQD